MNRRTKSDPQAIIQADHGHAVSLRAISGRMLSRSVRVLVWFRSIRLIVPNVGMPFSSDNLLRQLDRPEAVHCALNTASGREAYAFLLGKLGSPDLNVNQNINGVHVLFKMRAFGKREEVLDKFSELATDPRREVRSEAFKMAVGLVKFSIMSERNPLILSEEQDKNLRGAVKSGLSTRATRLARDFFTS